MGCACLRSSSRVVVKGLVQRGKQATGTMREPLLPPPEWTLLDTEAHVWRAALDAIPAAIEMRSECLSEDERARATLYTVDRERQRFIKSRIVLRHILA